MVQTTPHHCPRCNTPFAENQRICARCGFNLDDASLSGLNAPQEPYPGQPATQLPQPQQVSLHPLPPVSQQMSLHPLPPASQQVSQHPDMLQVDEIPTLIQPAVTVNPTSSPQSAPQVSQHPEIWHPDEVPTQAQPAVKPASSLHPETLQADEMPTQTQPTVNPTPLPQSGQQQASLHPETVQSAGQSASSPQPGQQQTSLHPETLQADEVPTQAQPTVNPTSLPQSGQQQTSLHPETVQSAGQSASSPQWGQQQPAQHPAAMQPVEQPASPEKIRSKKPVLIALVLLVLLVLGGVGYVGYAFFAHRAPTQTPIITTTIHSTAISYAGVDVTILSVQRSQTFLDDPNVTSDGSAQTTAAMVRLNLQAQNTMTAPVNMLYDKIARLVLPGGKIVNPIYVKAIPTIAPGTTQPAKIDFVVSAASKTDQLVLRLGASSEAQLDIPLTANADMSIYGPKTEQMNGQVVYQGLSWSLVNATTQLSVDGQQASSSMRFVTVTLKVDNALQQPAITGSPYDYLRLKAGNVTVSPLDSTLPLMFAEKETGKTGTVTFMVPQNATSFTLLFQQTGGFDAQKLSFQL